jgi:hypothetical protein
MRLAGRIDRLFPGDSGLVHGIGKGHLIAFRVFTGD